MCYTIQYEPFQKQDHMKRWQKRKMRSNDFAVITENVKYLVSFSVHFRFCFRKRCEAQKLSKRTAHFYYRELNLRGNIYTLSSS